MSFLKIHVALLALSVLSILAFAGVQAYRDQMLVVSADSSRADQLLPIGGAFHLVDENGTEVTEAAYPGKKLVLFGFTSCHTICPAALAKLSVILSGLDSKQRAALTPLFISVDPARDTPAVMKTYTDKFDSAIVGLTGTEDQIQETIRTFRSFARPDATSDQIEHTAVLYLMDEQNQMMVPYNMNESAETIRADLQKRL